MKFFMHVTEVFVGHVRIHLGRADIAMAKHGLHTPEVCAIHEQIGRKAMTHCMGRNMLRNTSEPGVFTDHSLYAAYAKSTIIATGATNIIAAVAQK